MNNLNGSVIFEFADGNEVSFPLMSTVRGVRKDWEKPTSFRFHICNSHLSERDISELLYWIQTECIPAKAPALCQHKIRKGILGDQICDKCGRTQEDIEDNA